jgi:histone H2B
MAKTAAVSTKRAASSSKKASGVRKTRKTVSFASYISKVLKGASKTKLTLSSKAVKILNSLVTDFFERVAVEAAALARSGKKRTLGSREVQTAVRLTLPAELAKHAMAEGTRAVAKASA